MLHTHYDNLKITRDAPLEVIRAAYRALSLLYHPDRNPGDPEAERNMALVNAAYAALSEAEKRQEYDDWLKANESKAHAPPRTEPGLPARSRREKSAFRRSTDASAALDPQDRWRNYGVWSAVVVTSILALLGAVALYRAQDVPHPLASMSVTPSEAPNIRESAATEARHLWLPSSASNAHSATSSGTPESVAVASKAATPAAASKPAVPKPPPEESPPKPVVRHDGHPYSDTAPNGEPWPQTSSYVHGLPILKTEGGSQLVIDNSHNKFDVFLKLVALNGDGPKTVRSIFVLARSQFTARRIESGTYEAHYRQLQSGALMKSATFVFDESAIAGGTRYSIVTLEVHGEPDEGVNTYALSEGEFDQ